jgi:LemA protein
MSAGWIVLAVIVVLIAYVILIYNRLVQMRNRFKNAFAQIDVQLTRRYELIPNLVESAKAYLTHERETLEKVIEARNQAAAAVKQAANQPGDAQAMGKLIGAESLLGSALAQFRMVVENYPDLKADKTIAGLMEELVSTENRVSFARQAYNDDVMVYNTQRESFPDVMLAGSFGFAAATLFEMPDTAARAPVKVSFDR